MANESVEISADDFLNTEEEISADSFLSGEQDSGYGRAIVRGLTAPFSLAADAATRYIPEYRDIAEKTPILGDVLRIGKQAAVRPGEELTTSQQVVEGLASTPVVLGAGLATGGLALPAVIGGIMGGEAGVQRAEQFEEKTGKEVSSRDKAIAAGLGATLGAGETFLPGSAVLGKGVLAPLVSTTAKKIGAEAGVNAAIGAASPTIENIAVQQTYNPEQETFEGAGTGALVGGIVGGAAQAIGGRTPSQPEAVTGAPKPPETPLDTSILPGFESDTATQPVTPQGPPDRLQFLQNRLAQQADPKSVIAKEIESEIKDYTEVQQSLPIIEQLKAEIDVALQAGDMQYANRLEAQRVKLQSKVDKVAERTAKFEEATRQSDIAESAKRQQAALTGSLDENKLPPRNDTEANQAAKFDEAVRLKREALGMQEFPQGFSDTAEGGAAAKETIESFDNTPPDLSTSVKTKTVDAAGKTKVVEVKPGQTFFMKGVVDNAPAIPKPDVDSVIADITSNFKNGPEVVVVNDINDPLVPDTVRQSEPKTEGQTITAYQDGKVYVIGNRITNKGTLVRGLIHESVGHHGLQATFGDRLEAMLQKLIKTSPDRIAEIKQRLGTDDDILAAHEAIAELSETSPKNTFVQQAVSVVRSVIRKFTDLKMTDQDIIREFIQPARRYVENSNKNLTRDTQSFKDNVFAGKDQDVSTNIIRLFYSGPPDRLRQSPMTKPLGDAIAKYYPDMNANLGEYQDMIKDTVYNISSNQVRDEWGNYFAKLNSGDVAGSVEVFKKSSPETQKAIVDTVAVLKKIGADLEADGFEIYNPQTGNRQPFKARDNYFPRIMKSEWVSVLNDPGSEQNVGKWNWLKSELVRMGTVPEAASAEKYLRDYTAYSKRRSGEFGNIEFTRQGGMPDVIYSFSPEALMRYISRVAERRAQINAFGQSTPDSPDMFEQILANPKITEDTKNYIKTQRDAIYHLKDGSPIVTDTGFDTFTNTATNFAAANHLGNPGTALRDLGSLFGMAGTPGYGAKALAKAIYQVGLGKTYNDSLDTTFRVGLAKRDMLKTFGEDNDFYKPKSNIGAKLERGSAQYAQFMFKIGLKQMAENYVRAVSGKMVENHINEYLPEVLSGNPKSTAAKDLLESLEEMGVNPERLAKEMSNFGESSAKTANRVVQKMANEILGSYQGDQVPAWMRKPQWRIVTQYLKWTAQQSRDIDRRFLRKIFDKSGKYSTEDKKKAAANLSVRLLYMAGGAQLINTLISWLVGYNNPLPDPDRMASYALDPDNKLSAEERIGGLMKGIWDAVMMGGGAGFFGSAAQTGEAFLDGFEDPRKYGKLINPFSPPSFSIVAALADSMNRYIMQGTLSDNDLEEILRKQQSFLRFNVGVADTFGVLGQERKIESDAKQDYYYIKSLLREYQEDRGIKVPENYKTDKNVGNLFGLQGISTKRRSKLTPVIEDIKLAIMSGNSEKAHNLMTAFLNDEEFTPEERVKGEASIKRAIAGSDPLFIPGGENDANQEADFMEWASARVFDENVNRLQETVDRYRNAANEVNLLEKKRQGTKRKVNPEAEQRKNENKLKQLQKQYQ